MQATWYVLEDGTAVDPAEVAPDKKGALRHKSGAAIAMRGDVPQSRGVDPDEERAKAAPRARDMRSEEPRQPYRTRDMERTNR